MKLFWKECQYIFRMPVFYIYCFFIAVFFFVVYMPAKAANYAPPEQGEAVDLGNGMTRLPYGEYSRVPDGDTDNCIRLGLTVLFREYIPNQYSVDKLGGTKTIHLSEHKQEQIKDILLQTFGSDFDNALSLAINDSRSFGGKTFYPSLEAYLLNAHFDISLDDFYTSMRKIGNIVGGRNAYQMPEDSFASLKTATFDEALAYYNGLIADKLFTRDRLTGGLARKFADNIGAVCLLFPALITAFFLLRTGKTNEILFSKSRSSAAVILAKCAALSVAALIPVFLVSVIETANAFGIATNYGISIDPFAFAKLILFWITPTVLFSVSSGALLTIATNTPVAVPIWLVLWFTQISAPPFVGDYSLGRMLIRFNSELHYDFYQLVKPEITTNRLFYLCLSLLFTALTIIIYEARRRGSWHVVVLPSIRKTKL